MSLKSQALEVSNKEDATRKGQSMRAGSVGVRCILYSYRFGCIIKHFPDIVSDPESGNRYMSEVVDISGSFDGSPLIMTTIPVVYSFISDFLAIFIVSFIILYSSEP